MSKKNFFDKHGRIKKKVKAQPFFGTTPFNTPMVPVNDLANIGIELELEGVRLPSTGYFDGISGKTSKARWTRKTDGSLRDGYEYVLSHPCTDEEVAPLLNGFFNVLDRNKTVLTLSNRCSTHVHLNVGGYKINELTSFIALWYVYETAFINWCGIERKTNHFCLGHKDSPAVAEAWRSFLTRGELTAKGLKYSALNIMTMQIFGSLEFRCMAGASNAETVIKWVRLLRSLQEYSKEHFQNPSDIAFAISERGPEELLRSILEDDPDFFQEILEANREENFEASCMEGLRSFQCNLFEFPWDEVMEEINSVYVPDPFKKPTRPKSRIIRPLPRTFEANEPF